MYINTYIYDTYISHTHTLTQRSVSTVTSKRWAFLVFRRTIYTYMHTYMIYINTCMHYIHKYIRVHYIHKYIKYINVYIFVCACVNVCICCVYVTKINTYKTYINTCMRYIHKYIHIWYMYTQLCVHVNMCVYVVCMLHKYICIYIYTYMYIYISGTDALKILTNCRNTLQPRLQQTRTLTRASNTCALKTSTKLLQHTTSNTLQPRLQQTTADTHIP